MGMSEIFVLDHSYNIFIPMNKDMVTYAINFDQ